MSETDSVAIALGVFFLVACVVVFAWGYREGGRSKLPDVCTCDDGSPARCSNCVIRKK
jgi:hypothetical protein